MFFFSLLFIRDTDSSWRKSSPHQTPAPEWTISEWINSAPLRLRDLKGKVVILEFFQMWCPGCNSFSIPLMHHWSKMYRDNPDVQLISIHSVFENHDQQNPGRLKHFIEGKKMTHPIGIDVHYSGDVVPLTMRHFQVEGTPEIIIIGKGGNIRFRRFGGFDFRKTEYIINELLNE